MGNTVSNVSRKVQAVFEEVSSSEYHSNPVLASLEKKHRDEVEELKRHAEKRAMDDQRSRKLAERQHKLDVETLQSKLDREMQERKAAELAAHTDRLAKEQAEHLKKQAEREARAAEQRAEAARLAKEKADREAEEAERVKKEAEEKAEKERKERERAEKARDRANASAEEHHAKELAAKEAAERDRVEREEAERKLRFENEKSAREREQAQAEKEEAERELAKSKRREAQHANLQPIPAPSKEEVERVKKERQYTEGLLHFAVAGVAGSGKSSLINAFRGISKGAAEAADTGVVETTKVIGRYPDPKRQRFVWYDIPGAGTANVGSAQYFLQQGLYIFDCIIVLFDNRFQETDIAILEQCERFNIPAFIVRSKSDYHIKAIADEMREQMEEEESEDEVDEDEASFRRRKARYASIEAEARTQYISTTRANVELNLKNAGLKPQRAYLISRRPLLRIVQEKKSVSTSRVIDEYELIQAVLASVKERRIKTPQKPKADTGYVAGVTSRVWGWTWGSS